MAKVYFFTEVENLPNVLDLLDIADFEGIKVPVKLHMGEIGNRFYISPSIVKMVKSSKSYSMLPNSGL